MEPDAAEPHWRLGHALLENEVLAGSPPSSLLHLGSRWLLNIAYMTIGDLAAAYLGLRFNKTKLARLYRSDGRGGFEDVAVERNLRRPNAPMGANFGDVDNDGYLDFYLGTGLRELQWPDAERDVP